MYRGIIIVILILLVLFFTLAIAGEESRVLQPVSFFVNNEVMLPARAVADFLGISIYWEAEEKRIYIGDNPVDGLLLAGIYYVPATEFSFKSGVNWQWFEDRKEGFIELESRQVRVSPRHPPRGDQVPGVYLSFDDGPNETIPSILDTLDIYGVKAIFFLVGENVLEYPEYARDIVLRGHQIGNHSFSHPLLTSLETEEVIKELYYTEKAFKKVMGINSRYFRPPYGGYNQEIEKIAANLGMETILWDINPQDFLKPGTEHMTGLISEQLAPRAHILLHCKFSTAQALPAIIETVWEAGYDFILLPKE